jgi:hypothetical protein
VIKIVAANLTDTITEKEIIDKIIPAYEHIQTGRRNKPSAGLYCCNRLSGWPSLGYRGASIGGTVKFQRLTLEPFINAGYQKLDLKGDGKKAAASGAITNLWKMDKPRQEWSIGGGSSIKF